VSALLELGKDLFGHVDRHREADRVRLRVDRGVDADHLAREVQQRTARVARIDGGVGLDEVVVGPLADVPAGSAHDAGGDGVVETERISDRDHPVAGKHRVGVAERERQVLALRLGPQQRDVGLRVLSDHLRVAVRAVGEDDVDLLDVLDHVVVGDDQTLIRDHESGSQTRHREAARRGGSLRLLRNPEEIPEQVGKGKAARRLLRNGPRGVDVDDARRDLTGQHGEAGVHALAAYHLAAHHRVGSRADVRSGLCLRHRLAQPVRHRLGEEKPDREPDQQRQAEPDQTTHDPPTASALPHQRSYAFG
jgi:hypothetical protein